MKNFAPTQKNGFRIALASLAVFAALGTAARAEDAPQVHVSYADLNLATDAGAKVLFQRIHAAAERVCEVPNMRDLSSLSRAQACTDHAIAVAVEAVKAPALTKIYDAKYRVAPSTVVALR